MKGVYILANFPNQDIFKKELDYLLSSKVDFIEIGLPFNDPVADGPVIAKAANEVSEKGYSINDIADMIPSTDKDIYVMTYSNIIYRYGFENFSDRFSFLKGVIVADLPNVGHNFFVERNFKLPIIPFATPESRVKDLERFNSYSGDFVYFIGIRGITGGEVNFNNYELIEKYLEIKKYTHKKIIVGFGIKTKNDVEAVLSFADGFVIGTEIVRRQTDFDEFKKYVDLVYE